MRLLFAVVLSALTFHALAGEADVRKAFEARFPGSKVASVSKTPLPGIYEIVADDNQLAYVDEKAEYLVLGEIIDLKSRRNLTREKVDQLMAIRFDSLPLQNAIKFVKGDGKRVLAVFSDVDCPFCKRLEPELAKLDNVTIYVFPYPIASLHPNAGQKSKQIWCSKDRAQAWQDFMLKGKQPAKAADCKNPVDENVAFGQKLGISGTPTLVFANGRRVPGYIQADKIEALLKETGKAK
jgi:thiol:disulfide interchange protein DsbC